jgi:hypothetical protein
MRKTPAATIPARAIAVPDGNSDPAPHYEVTRMIESQGSVSDHP